MAPGPLFRAVIFSSGALLVAACGGARPAADAPPVASAALGTPSAASSSSTAPTATPTPSVTATPTVTSTPTATAPTAKPSSTGTASAPPATKSKSVAAFDDPAFEGGDIPKVKETLEKFAKKVEKCVDDAGGVDARGASIKIQFLVRAKGIAEGIDVLDVHDLDEKPGKCVRDVFKKKSIGTPSSDPVGVTFTITFTPRPSP